MYIDEFPNAVSLALCAEIVEQFERDPSRRPSFINEGGVLTTARLRSGTMVALDRSVPEWERIFQELVPSIRSTVDTYLQRHAGLAALVDSGGIDCTLPLIEKTQAGQGFDWHYDVSSSEPDRVLAGLLYLTTVKEGGYTEFAEPRRRISCEAGKIALFPPYWTHLHRGVPPAPTAEDSNTSKYVLSFFWRDAAKPRLVRG